jgi:hypothetical protein
MAIGRRRRRSVLIETDHLTIFSGQTLQKRTADPPVRAGYENKARCVVHVGNS